jgi:uncharacterized protein YegP (UPF0339 family)
VTASKAIRKRRARIFVWHDGDGWRWLMRGRNGRFVAESQHDYPRRSDAMNAIAATLRAFRDDDIAWNVQEPPA